MLVKKIVMAVSLVVAASTYAATADETEARLVSASAVNYPVAARVEGLEGFAVLELNVDEKGQIKTSRIEKSAGSKLLDDAALEWVKSIELAPATRNGVAVSSIKKLKVSFNLKDDDLELQAVNSETDPAKRAQKLEDYSFKKLRANPAFAVCGQNAYLKCYATTYSQCVDQVNRLKGDCYTRIKLQHPHADAAGSLADFSDAYFACISENLAGARKIDVENVRQCLGGETINDAKFISDLQQ